ncbi:Arginine/serine-rich coiled coil protein [Theobroma cacao]|uniref:Arginine/serine-rich coiled coil protein n=1 Tax=Theobroma cacao TaxID=3641 RepID=A0A061FU10_THECC|nr:Arginine/serine-rich coiled coil protein [Theobroma cacao]
MEEEKAVAYYEELTRKGEGAARFKRGLGFSSNDDQHDAVPQRSSAFVSSSSSSSFLSSFVRASSPATASKLEKESQLQSIQNKLKKKPEREARVSERSSGERERERDRGKDRHSRRRSRSRSRSRERYRERDRERRRRRSRSRSPRRDRRRSRSRSPRRDRSSGRRRSRSLSPRERRRSERDGERVGNSKKERNGAVDYSQLIEGYDKMSPAERVKAKMKLQLAETAEKDPAKGPGWERFEFDRDAPLDDEEIEVAEDDAALVKHIGQSFRFSAIKARREEQIKAAHDEAIFGASTVSLSITADSEPEEENHKKNSNDNGLAISLLSEKVLAKQPGSWRDRVRKA